MKKSFIIYLVLVLCSSHIHSQINPREFNEEYMYTVFKDDFNGDSINRNDWAPGLIHRGIGQLIDSSLTHSVSNGKLGLTMAYIPNYNDSSNFVGGEFASKIAGRHLNSCGNNTRWYLQEYDIKRNRN